MVQRLSRYYHETGDPKTIMEEATQLRITTAQTEDLKPDGFVCVATVICSLRAGKEKQEVRENKTALFLSKLFPIFKIIFAIIFAPIRWLANLLISHKDNLLEWHFNYGPYFIHIKTKHREQFLTDGLLIASYILFLARYFYICDERQTEVIKDLLRNEIGNKKNNYKELSSKIWDAIWQTLNETERHAVSNLYSNIFRGMPPLSYSEEETNRSYAKYSFLVFERRNDYLTSIFQMSAGADIIFLPLTVAVLYVFVVNKLRDKNKKEILNKAIVDLLEAYNKVDCRSLAGLERLPVEIINQNNIDY